MKLATAKQMKRIDDRAINVLGVSGILLMENAAGHIAETVAEHCSPGEGKICAVCGSGNNGGDGACAAWMLKNRGYDAAVVLVGSREKFTPDMLEMISRCEAVGVNIISYPDGGEKCIMDSAVIIDAMFGVGLNSSLREPAASAARVINESKAFVIAADIPSGVDADSGRVLGSGVKADVTVTFSMAKPGHMIGEGAVLTGKLLIRDIGIPEQAVEGESFPYSAFDEEDLDRLIPVRKAISHKGDYGKVLLICGSEGYTGAASMAAQAAMRTGSGLVTLCVPRCVYPIVAGRNMEVMVHPLADKNGKISHECIPFILEKMSGADVIVIGPGLGRGAEVDEVVKAVLIGAEVPVVLDADGLNSLAENIDVLKQVSAPVVITPHEGEFRRLGGKTEDGRLENALAFAREHGCITVLKGSRTVTAMPDGRAFVNTTGNPGMAKGGSGDVLTGVIASLIGQKLPTEEAAAAAQYIHGKAGDICADELGQYSMLPTDMINAIPKVLRKYQ